MSVHISSAIWKDKTTTGNARLLLLCLADMANDDGVCWPSIATLRERLNVTTDRAVQKLLHDLEQSNHITREIRTARSTVYRVNTDSPRTTVHPEQRFTLNADSPVPRTTVHPYPEQRFTTTLNSGSPITVIEPSKEPSTEPSCINAHAAEPARLPVDEEAEGMDAFTPEELRSEPLPAPAPKRQQASAKRRVDEERTAIMQAYRAVRFDRPLTDSIPEAEFNRMKGHADSLLALGVTPEQVGAATDEALNRTEPKYVTLGYLAGHWTEITTPLPAPRPSAIAGPVRLTAAEQRDARQKAERDAEYEQLARIERELYGEQGRPSAPIEPSGGRVLVSDDAFARPPRRILDSMSARRVVQ